MEERIVTLEKKVAALEQKLQNGRAPAMADPRIGQIRDTMERLALAKRESLQRANQVEGTEEDENEEAAVTDPSFVVIAQSYDEISKNLIRDISRRM